MVNPQDTVFSLETVDGIVKMTFHRGIRDEKEDLEVAKKVEAAMQEIFDRLPNVPVRIFFNILSIKQTDLHTKGKARRIYIRIFSNPQIRNVAVVVQSSFFKTLIDFYSKAIGSAGRSKIFSNEEEASKWLRSLPPLTIY